MLLASEHYLWKSKSNQKVKKCIFGNLRFIFLKCPHFFTQSRPHQGSHTARKMVKIPDRENTGNFEKQRENTRNLKIYIKKIKKIVPENLNYCMLSMK